MPSLNRQNSAAQWKAKPLEARVTESANIRTSKPGQVPVIVELHKNPGLLPALPRNKYLVSARAPVASLRDAIAQDAQSKWQGKIHLFLLDTTTELDYARPLGKLDQESADADGFLYIAVSSEQKPTKSVPYAKSLLGQADAGSRPSSTSSAASSTESLTSPHGERLPDGATIASCTFLNPRANGRLLPELRPTGDGRVPASLYLATILDVTAVGLVVPLLATYSRALGAGPRFTGLLQATYGLAQLIGANILGGVSDRVGRRTMLRLSSFGGLMGYASLSYAVGPNGSLPLLLASRLPIGLLKQSLTVSRALVADATEVGQRLQPMARLGGCVGVGFVLGPGFGGVLSKKLGLQFPPMLAACLFLLSHLVVALRVPETAPLPLSVRELRAVLKRAEKLWVEAACQEAVKAGEAGGLVIGVDGEVASLLPASGRYDGSAGPKVPSAERVELPLKQVLAVARSSISRWTPNGKPLTQTGGADAALNVWTLALTREAAKSGRNAVSWSAFRALAADAYAELKVRTLLLARALVELSVMVTHATFADYTRAKFGWDQKRTGYGMALSGLISVLVDLVLLPPLHSRRLLSELAMGLLGGLAVAFGLLCLAFTPSTNGFFGGLALLSLGASLYKSALASMVMGCARRDESGTISGAMDAMEAVCRVLAPIAGGLLLEHGVAGLEGPPLLGACLAVMGVVALYEVAPKRARKATKQA